MDVKRLLNAGLSRGFHQAFPSPGGRVRVTLRVTFRVTKCGSRKNEMFALGLRLGLHFCEKFCSLGGGNVQK